ncbi:MAG: ABC transporter permease [Tepidanaerobacteraceae bacterium]|nr:ABC transporter permease [Tepidanaerobacteraceae bacterium]
MSVHKNINQILPNDLHVTKTKLVLKNFKDFLKKLKKHPSALIGAILLIIYVTISIFAPFIALHDPKKTNLNIKMKPAVWNGGEWTYPFGTDQLGRDIFSRIIYGARVSLLVGFITVMISIIIGTFLGCIAGYYMGRLDAYVSRFADLLLAFPFLIFSIGAMAMLGPGFWNLIFALSFKSWVEFFRLVRGEVLAEKTKEYVEAAKVLGMKDIQIIVSEILPNIVHSILVLGTLRIGYLIIMEASLSYLGLGIPPSIPAWGSMIEGGRDYMFNAHWISTYPGVVLVILVLAINMFGEGLRDILDPRLKLE